MSEMPLAQPDPSNYIDISDLGQTLVCFALACSTTKQIKHCTSLDSFPVMTYVRHSEFLYISLNMIDAPVLCLKTLMTTKLAPNTRLFHARRQTSLLPDEQDSEVG